MSKPVKATYWISYFLSNWPLRSVMSDTMCKNHHETYIDAEYRKFQQDLCSSEHMQKRELICVVVGHQNRRQGHIWTGDLRIKARVYRSHGNNATKSLYLPFSGITTPIIFTTTTPAHCTRCSFARSLKMRTRTDM